LSIAEGAKKQFIAERTAYNVMAAVRKKAGAGSNEQLVVIAFREEWLSIDDDGKVVTVAADFSL
jgi:DNA-binding CsgD family transcriptional regulator